MTRMARLFAALAFVAGCSSAYAEQVEGPPPGSARTAIAIASAPAKIRAPYDVQIIRENGETLPTYAAKDRFYVQGNAGERYILRITNPTPNRVEAVVTVDGLDVVDGEVGSLSKRGYIVPAYGETRIEGFRTSAQDVATFRFSSVNDSYAGKQGKARNVGVVAVALFEEQAAQQIIEPAPPPPSVYNYEDDVDGRVGTTRSGGGVKDKKYDSDGDRVASRQMPAHGRGVPPPSSASGPSAGAPADARAPMPAKVAPSPPREGGHAERQRRELSDNDGAADEAEAPRTNRPGLGTEYGEQRYSATSFTRFQRAADRPIAIAELRYNDTAGLMALGIQVQPLPDAGEIMTRETADPFPGSHYAMPPR